MLYGMASRLLAAIACLIALAAAIAMLGAGPAGAGPGARIAATCSDYSTQADAQRAADTRDTDGDGIFCESLPCPCLRPGSGNPSPTPTPPRRTCTRPWAVQLLAVSRTRYPDIRRHTIRAI